MITFKATEVSQVAIDVKKTIWKIVAANELPDGRRFPETNLNLYRSKTMAKGRR
jgi:hypothetical protein